MKSFTVSKADDGQRLSRYLEKRIPGLPASLMYKAIRKKDIKVNRKRCDAADRLREGDVIDVYLKDDLFREERKLPDFMKASQNLSVVYEDGNMAVLYKPSGVLVHDDTYGNIRDTLINRFLRYLYEKGEYDPADGNTFVPALCNRLDRGTSGLVLAAKNRNSLAELDRIVKERLVDKYYLCVCLGIPPKDGVYTAYLRKNELENLVSITDSETAGSREIRTGDRTLKRNGDLSQLDGELITGRTHQIRAHLSHLGCPILGDGKYGIGAVNRSYQVTRQCLTAFKLVFHPDSSIELLSYLDGRTVRLKQDAVWFLDEYFKGIKL